MADHLQYIRTYETGHSTKLIVQMQGGGAQVEFVPGCHHINVVGLLRMLADEIERGVSQNWTHSIMFPDCDGCEYQPCNHHDPQIFDYCPAPEIRGRPTPAAPDADAPVS